MPNWAKVLDWSKMVMNKENKNEVCNAIEYLPELYDLLCTFQKDQVPKMNKSTKDIAEKRPRMSCEVGSNTND